MQAQIAEVLFEVNDKDGEAILPFGIRVPRRQLIDYHGDLYPDIMGSSECKRCFMRTDPADNQ